MTTKTSVAAQNCTTSTVTSKDGTTIGYRQIGDGPGLILVHGGMQSSQNFTRLATALSDEFCVYLPDRRGRGMSGPYGDDYHIGKAVEDMQSLLEKTGASNVFGLSAGALIALQSALELPQIQRLAIYEPPLSINGSTPTGWLPRYEREIAENRLGAAFVTAMKGIQAAPLLDKMPRFVSVPMMTLGMKADAKEANGDDVSLESLVPTLHFDVQMVFDTENTLEKFGAVCADVLLMGGSKSPAYLRFALEQLNAVLPRVRWVEFPGLDHLAADDSGQPERVALELRDFFSKSPNGRS